MTTGRICDGRVVIVTGAGRGIGRAHALAFAAEGARVVVNDIGVSLDGQAGPDGGSASPAEEVVAEIEAAGGQAVVNGDDIASWDGAARLVDQAVEVFGGLDVVVNNAGFVRDRMFVSCTEDEWDAVVRVHLKGHFCVSRHAAAFWRDRSKASDGAPVDARIINTSSGAGILGSVGQSSYGAAKAGIATLTLIQAAELGRYGVTANAICPAARTRMTEGVFTDMMAAVEEGQFDAMDPGNVSPLVVWLGSPQSAAVTGRVFEVEGGKIGVAEGWTHGPSVDAGRRWAPAEVGEAVAKVLAEAQAPTPVYGTQP
jgi:NAD(P)-dependent dehydrogenase (short-subunit alcohol dehydrogenase family)